jgi:hypothetical protein
VDFGPGVSSADERAVRLGYHIVFEEEGEGELELEQLSRNQKLAQKEPRAVVQVVGC